MPLTESLQRSQTGKVECPQFRNGLAIAGEDVVMAFTYTPLCPNAAILDQTTDCLSDVFSDLSPHHRGRAIVEFTGEACRHWLLLHVGPAGASAVPHMMAALEQRTMLLTRLQDAGLSVDVASPEACRELVSGFPQPHIEDRRVVDHEGRTVVTLTMRESGDVTQPGITRELVDFLCNRGRVAYLVLDFRNEAGGLSRFDLTLVLTACDETDGRLAAREVEDMVFDSLGALARRDTSRRSVATLHRAAPFARAKAMLPACAANIADLFPL